jgi:hypothetical protein
LGKARDESGGDRVAKRDHDDRDRVGCVLRRLGGRGSGHDDDVRFELQTFGSESRKSLAPAICGQVINADGLPINVTQVTQALEERIESVRLRRTGIKREEAEPWGFPHLLRFTDERRGEHRSEASDEGAAIHSMT